VKIAVIGAGWFGCHIANKLKNNHEVSIFDSSNIFFKASIKNQNRLHLGFHYARNSATRLMCKNTFDKFSNEYSHLLRSIPQNIYAIPERESIIDFDTYIKIFENYQFENKKLNYLNNVAGCIRVDEKYIDPFLAQAYFKNSLKDIFQINHIDDIDNISSSYDLVINCTNNQLNPIIENSFSQPCTIFIYQKINDTPFDALTLVDGPLFSIFPFFKNTFTISDVEYTPDSNLSYSNRVAAIENKISYYYPDFNKNFKSLDYLKAIKSKPVDMSDGRNPIITINKNIINCYSGKIQGIYYFEDYMRTICEF